MWNQEGFGNTNFHQKSGGFVNSPVSPNDSQGIKKTRKTQNLVPVTIQHIFTSTDEGGVKISNTEAHLVEVIGLIKKVEQTSTKTTYTMDDTSGVLEAVYWNESDEDDLNQQPIMENTYCRIIGQVRAQQNKKYVVIFKIMPIIDLNEITMHVLEVVYAELKLKELKNKNERNTTFPPAVNQSENCGNNYLTSRIDLSSEQKMVYSLIQTSKEESGIQQQTIVSMLRGRLSADNINNILEFLINEGHIYSTIDELHFKATENYE